MIVLGLDPGTEQSAYVTWDGERVHDHAISPNEHLLSHFMNIVPEAGTVLAIEKIESYGMAVGASTFRTVFWSGRFAQAWCPNRFVEVTRRDVKIHLCHSARATDANIRQALLDRFGPVGVKAKPGLFYGLKGHEFAALAVAVTFHDQHAGELRPGVEAQF